MGSDTEGVGGQKEPANTLETLDSSTKIDPQTSGSTDPPSINTPQFSYSFMKPQQSAAQMNFVYPEGGFKWTPMSTISATPTVKTESSVCADTLSRVKDEEKIVLTPLTDVITGEEDEDNLIQAVGTFFVFVDGKRWSNRGRCCFKLNEGESENGAYARIIIRCKFSKRCLVNSYVWKGMKVEFMTDNTVIFGVLNVDTKKPEICSFRTSQKWAKEIYYYIRFLICEGDKVEAESSCLTDRRMEHEDTSQADDKLSDIHERLNQHGVESKDCYSNSVECSSHLDGNTKREQPAGSLGAASHTTTNEEVVGHYSRCMTTGVSGSRDFSSMEQGQSKEATLFSESIEQKLDHLESSTAASVDSARYGFLPDKTEDGINSNEVNWGLLTIFSNYNEENFDSIKFTRGGRAPPRSLTSNRIEVDNQEKLWFNNYMDSPYLVHENQNATFSGNFAGGSYGDFGYSPCKDMKDKEVLSRCGKGVPDFFQLMKGDVPSLGDKVEISVVEDKNIRNSYSLMLENEYTKLPTKDSAELRTVENGGLSNQIDFMCDKEITMQKKEETSLVENRPIQRELDCDFEFSYDRSDSYRTFGEHESDSVGMLYDEKRTDDDYYFICNNESIKSSIPHGVWLDNCDKLRSEETVNKEKRIGEMIFDISGSRLDYENKLRNMSHEDDKKNENFLNQMRAGEYLNYDPNLRSIGMHEEGTDDDLSYLPKENGSSKSHEIRFIDTGYEETGMERIFFNNVSENNLDDYGYDLMGTTFGENTFSDIVSSNDTEGCGYYDNNFMDGGYCENEFAGMIFSEAENDDQYCRFNQINLKYEDDMDDCSFNNEDDISCRGMLFSGSVIETGGLINEEKFSKLGKPYFPEERCAGVLHGGLGFDYENQQVEDPSDNGDSKLFEDQPCYELYFSSPDDIFESLACDQIQESHSYIESGRVTEVERAPKCPFNRKKRLIGEYTGHGHCIVSSPSSVIALDEVFSENVDNQVNVNSSLICKGEDIFIKSNKTINIRSNEDLSRFRSGSFDRDKFELPGVKDESGTCLPVKETEDAAVTTKSDGCQRVACGQSSFGSADSVTNQLGESSSDAIPIHGKDPLSFHDINSAEINKSNEDLCDKMQFYEEASPRTISANSFESDLYVRKPKTESSSAAMSLSKTVLSEKEERAVPKTDSYTINHSGDFMCASDTRSRKRRISSVDSAVNANFGMKQQLQSNSELSSIQEGDGLPSNLVDRVNDAEVQGSIASNRNIKNDLHTSSQPPNEGLPLNSEYIDSHRKVMSSLSSSSGAKFTLTRRKTRLLESSKDYGKAQIFRSECKTAEDKKSDEIKTLGEKRTEEPKITDDVCLGNVIEMSSSTQHTEIKVNVLPSEISPEGISSGTNVNSSNMTFEFPPQSSRMNHQLGVQSKSSEESGDRKALLRKEEMRIIREQTGTRIDKIEKLLSIESKEKLIRKRVKNSGVKVDEEKLIKDCMNGTLSLRHVMEFIKDERRRIIRENIQLNIK